MGETDRLRKQSCESERRQPDAPAEAGQFPSLPPAMLQRKLARRALARRAGGDDNGVGEGAEHLVGRAASSGGEGLPAPLQRKFESSLGADLSGVRVHTGAESAAAAESVSARAYTVGNDVHFGAGQYNPGSSDGQHLLAHEVAHTVQQSGSAPGPQFKLDVSSPGDASEHEADRAADAMVSGAPAAVAVGSGVARQVARKIDLKLARIRFKKEFLPRYGGDKEKAKEAYKKEIGPANWDDAILGETAAPASAQPARPPSLDGNGDNTETCDPNALWHQNESIPTEKLGEAEEQHDKDTKEAKQRAAAKADPSNLTFLWGGKEVILPETDWPKFYHSTMLPSYRKATDHQKDIRTQCADLEAKYKAYWPLSTAVNVLGGATTKPLMISQALDGKIASVDDTVTQNWWLAGPISVTSAINRALGFVNEADEAVQQYFAKIGKGAERTITVIKITEAIAVTVVTAGAGEGLGLLAKAGTKGLIGVSQAAGEEIGGLGAKALDPKMGPVTWEDARHSMVNIVGKGFGAMMEVAVEHILPKGGSERVKRAVVKFLSTLSEETIKNVAEHSGSWGEFWGEMKGAFWKSGFAGAAEGLHAGGGDAAGEGSDLLKPESGESER